MGEYEVTYLIPGKLPDSESEHVRERVRELARGAEFRDERVWGKRTLAYPIGGEEQATIVTISLGASSDKIGDFDRALRVEDGILRHLVVLKDARAKPATLAIPEVRMRRRVTAKKEGEEEVAREIRTREKKLRTLEEKLEEILKE